jgi:hypothetical protein
MCNTSAPHLFPTHLLTKHVTIRKSQLLCNIELLAKKLLFERSWIIIADERLSIKNLFNRMAETQVHNALAKLQWPAGTQFFTVLHGIFIFLASAPSCVPG